MLTSRRVAVLVRVCLVLLISVLFAQSGSAQGKPKDPPKGRPGENALPCQVDCPPPPPPTTIRVTPDGGTTGAAPNSTGNTVNFSVFYTSGSTAFRTFTLTCLGKFGVTCTGVSPTSVNLRGPDDDRLVTVTYSAGATVGGTISLTATSGTLTDAGSYTVKPRGLSVTPDGGVAANRVTGTGGYSETFTIQNTGQVAENYTLSCSGSANVTCSGTTPSTLSLAIGASATATANYSVGATGTGNLTLTASSTGISDAGTYSIPVIAPGPQAPVVATATVNPGPFVERSLCLTVSLGASAAAECSDLRIVHQLPTTRTHNRPHTPTLIYNSQFAHPYPIIVADVTLPAGATVPDSVTAKLTIANVQRAAGTWAGSQWTSGSTRRIALGFDGLNDATGFKDWMMEVRNWYGTASQAATEVGRISIVNRKDSPFGAGWWIAGMEQLIPATMMWIGGDGSVRVYTPVPGMTRVWIAGNVDHPDTLKQNDTNGDYTRFDKDSVRVIFTATGHHAITRNRQQHSASFGYDTSWRPASIFVSPATPGGKFYRIAYATDQVTITAPPPSPTSSRITTLTLNAGRLMRIQDPDTTEVNFTYNGTTNRIATRANRLGRVTSYTYDPGWRVRNSRVIGPVPQALVTTFTAAETRGLAGSPAVDTAKVYALIDGRRTDVADTTAVWLDYQGAPRKIVDALGHVTTLERNDGRWPGLVTRVNYPNGFATSASYDNRGNLVSSAALNPLGDGRNASTQYRWDPKWDEVTRITRPELDSVTFSYDVNNGNRTSQRDGRGSATQVFFGYDGYNQLNLIRLPGNTGDDLIGYDVMGNVNLLTTPQGYKTRTTNDSAGRVIKREIQVDAAATIWRAESLAYDARDRVVLQITTGPALNGTAKQTVTVRTSYTAEGQADTILRSVSPNPAALATMRTTFAYDYANRKVAEFAPDHSTTLPRVDSTFYDQASNVVRSSNRLGQLVFNDYDALNRVVRTRTETVQYGYRYDGIPKQRGNLFTACAEGTPQTVKPDICKFYPRLPNDGSTGYVIKADTAIFDYDNMGRLIQADNASARVRRQYFPGGALRRDSLYIRTWAPLDSGGTFATHAYGLLFSYDLNGRRKTLTHPLQFGHLLGDATGTTTSIESYGYDPGHGQLSSVRNPLNVVWNIGLNLRGELATLSALQGVAAESFGYDPDGNLVSDVINNNERQTTITYDPRGLMTQVRNTVGDMDTLNFYYSGMGHLLADTVAAYGKDQFGRPLRYRGFETYTADPLGNRLSFTSFSDLTPEGGMPGAMGPRVERDYNYEAKTGRLVRAPDPKQLNQRDSTSYDAVGNIVFSTAVPSPQEDRASFYAGNGQLAASDWRLAVGTTTLSGRWFFEEYKYDALGRRVAVLARRDCDGIAGEWLTECKLSWIRRTVWDGDEELWEVQMPLEQMENDVNPVQLTGGNIQKNAFYGIVGYTNGLTTDRPFGFLRVNYASQASTAPTYKVWQPFTLLPFYDVKGHPATGYISDGTIVQCNDAQTNSSTHCVRIDWPFEWHAYRGYETIRLSWHGSILADKRDATGTMYRRNRYYDPGTGRFTQEDPIGLAGGMNLYGFAGGDPVNFSDPFGLCKDSRRGNLTQSQGLTECERFARFVENLARRSKNTGSFIRALGESVSGFPNGIATPFPDASKVKFGESGFQDRFVDRDGHPARHFTANVVLAFQVSGAVSQAAALMREIPPACFGGCSFQDMLLGSEGARAGQQLSDGSLDMSELGNWIRRRL